MKPKWIQIETDRFDKMEKENACYRNALIEIFQELDPLCDLSNKMDKEISFAPSAIKRLRDYAKKGLDKAVEG